MKKSLLVILSLALSALTFGCDKKQEEADEPKAEQPAEEPEGEAPAEEPEAEPEADDAPAEKVEVAAEGTEFDPPVQPEQLPEDAWYCDMGTAHWAGMDKPEDGKCPVCGMKVKQYKPDEHAAQKAKAIEAGDDHHHDGDEDHQHDGEEDHHHGDDDHDHGDEEHGHEH